MVLNKTKVFEAIEENNLNLLEEIYWDARKLLYTTTRNDTVLTAAIDKRQSSNSMAVVKRILTWVPDLINVLRPNVSEPPIFLAIENNDLECLRYLLQMDNLDVNMTDLTCNWTALHSAVCRKNIEAVRMLLTHPKINLTVQCYLHKNTAVHESKDKFMEAYDLIKSYAKRNSTWSIINSIKNKNSLIPSQMNLHWNEMFDEEPDDERIMTDCLSNTDTKNLDFHLDSANGVFVNLYINQKSPVTNSIRRVSPSSDGNAFSANNIRSSACRTTFSEKEILLSQQRNTAESPYCTSSSQRFLDPSSDPLPVGFYTDQGDSIGASTIHQEQPSSHRYDNGGLPVFREEEAVNSPTTVLSSTMNVNDSIREFDIAKLEPRDIFFIKKLNQRCNKNK